MGSLNINKPLTHLSELILCETVLAVIYREGELRSSLLRKHIRDLPVVYVSHTVLA